MDYVHNLLVFHGLWKRENYEAAVRLKMTFINIEKSGKSQIDSAVFV